MKTRRFLIALYAFLLLAALPERALAIYNYANIVSPPAITVVTYRFPEDLEIQVEVEKKGESRLADTARTRRVWELNFQVHREEVFRTNSFRGNDRDFAGAVLLCRSGGEEHRVPIPQEYLTTGGSRDVMTLDCESWTLSAGVPGWRGPVIVVERVALILMVRALFFLLMKYRTLRSWLSFLGVSLLTQIPLNLVLKNTVSVDDFAMRSKVFLGVLLVVSVVIMVIETMLMAVLVKEHDRDHTTIYVVGGNVLGVLALVAALLLLPL